MKELTIEAAVDNLDAVLAFVEEALGPAKCPPKTRVQIDLAVEEIFVNIAHYAYAPETGMATVRVETTEDPAGVAITFMDRGVPYDPLAREDPDVTMAAEERQIGGLGVYMTKKIMDDVSYLYSGGQNILTMKKKL